MILNAFYNKVNDVLVVNTGLTSKSHKIDGDIVSFYNEENELVGMNLFNQSNFDQGIVPYDKLPEIVKSSFAKPSANPFVWGYIEKCEKHPKSDKLQVCSVNIGTSIEQIVCGAKNCAQNNYVCVATLGAIMPNGMKIVQASVAGIESSGMLCSEKELGLVGNSESGIILTATEKVLGSAFELGVQ
jgi:tRNA-binding protein